METLEMTLIKLIWYIKLFKCVDLKMICSHFYPLEGKLLCDVNAIEEGCIRLGVLLKVLERRQYIYTVGHNHNIYINSKNNMSDIVEIVEIRADLLEELTAQLADCHQLSSQLESEFVKNRCSCVHLN